MAAIQPTCLATRLGRGRRLALRRDAARHAPVPRPAPGGERATVVRPSDHADKHAAGDTDEYAGANAHRDATAPNGNVHAVSDSDTTSVCDVEAVALAF